MSARPLEEIRENIADLEKSLAQIHRWRTIQGATAPDRSPHQLDDELLEVCLLLVQDIQRMSGETLQSLANSKNFTAISAQIHCAQFRAVSAVIAQVNSEACRILNKVTPRSLQKCFPEYGDFFATLRDAVLWAERPSNSSKDRTELLTWSAENLETFISQHKRLVASEPAAVREKWRHVGKVIVAWVTVVVGVLLSFRTEILSFLGYAP